jgi:hypothetical protein
MKDTKEIFGIVEHVSLPDVGVFNVPAKIDTGAYSGALHCSKIQEHINESDGKKILEITFPDGHKTELTKYWRTHIRSSTGHRIKRYLFETNIVIKGIARNIRIGLSDRSDMNYEVLIGRRFLNENNILVDVRINQDLDIDREKKL